MAQVRERVSELTWDQAKFLPIMSKFVESRGGQSTASLLEKPLK